jgi:NADP-dependent aldehyde dehydrogenase
LPLPSHGGPFPATSKSRSTSVGASAIERFLRPVCYQDVPAELLPEGLRDDNRLGLARMRTTVAANKAALQNHT